MMTLYVIVRALHILGGVFWVGTVFFLVRFLGPTAGRVPGGGAFMEAIATQSRFPAAIGAAAGTTMISGLILYGVDSRGFQGGWILSPTGIMFTIGALATAAIAWISYSRPAVENALSAKDEERLAWQRRAARGGTIASAFLLLAVLAMASARYI
jgi:uncharacterized membrane protein